MDHKPKIGDYSNLPSLKEYRQLNLEERTKHLEAQKLIEEIRSSKLPYFKRASSWVSLFTAALGISIGFAQIKSSHLKTEIALLKQKHEFDRSEKDFKDKIKKADRDLALKEERLSAVVSDLDRVQSAREAIEKEREAIEADLTAKQKYLNTAQTEISEQSSRHSKLQEKFDLVARDYETKLAALRNLEEELQLTKKPS